jgi:ABC-type dipeptide/oligopeptide/nickel transport system permease component
LDADHPSNGVLFPRRNTGKDFVRTARAKGAPFRVVVYKHALRNALIPVVTRSALYILSMLSGSISIELVFSRPGIGTSW